MVLEARNLLKQLSSTDRSIATALVGGNYTDDKLQEIINALHSFDYDAAAKEIYGTTYPDWKKRHQKKATDEQL